MTQLVLAGPGSAGMVWGPLCPPCTDLMLPALPWHCHPLQSLGGMVPAAAPLHSWQEVREDRRALCSQGELTGTAGAFD